MADKARVIMDKRKQEERIKADPERQAVEDYCRRYRDDPQFRWKLQRRVTALYGKTTGGRRDAGSSARPTVPSAPT